MSSEPAKAKSAICSEKQQLADAFHEAVRDLMALQDQQLAALCAGRDGLDRINLALTVARLRRLQAKQRYLLHVEKHGC